MRRILHTETFSRQGVPMMEAQSRAMDWCKKNRYTSGSDIDILVDGENLKVTVVKRNPLSRTMRRPL